MQETFEVGQRVFVDHTSTNVLGGQEMYAGEAEVMQVLPGGWLMIRYYDKPTLYQVEPKFVSAIEKAPFEVGQRVIVKRSDPMRGSYTELATVLSLSHDGLAASVVVDGKVEGERLQLKLLTAAPEEVVELPEGVPLAEGGRATVELPEDVLALCKRFVEVLTHKGIRATQVFEDLIETWEEEPDAQDVLRP